MTEGRQTDGLTVRRTPIDRILEWSTDGLTDWLLSYLLNYNVHSGSTWLHVSKFLTKNACLLLINTITVMTKKTSKKTLFSPLKPHGYRTYLILTDWLTDDWRTDWLTDWLTEGLTVWLKDDRRTVWRSDGHRSIESLNDRLTDWLIDCSVTCSIITSTVSRLDYMYLNFSPRMFAYYQSTQ